MVGAGLFRRGVGPLVAALGLHCAPALAQPVVPPPGVIEPRPVAPGIWVIDETPAHGGSVTVFAGSDGVLLIDTGVENWAPAVAAAAARLSPLPVRLVINTHGHVDEIGGNAFFARGGAAVIGHDGARRAIVNRKPAPPGADGRTARQARVFPPETAPKITFLAQMGLTFNGEDIRLIAVPAAHTDNDILIRFPGRDVIVVGDVLRAGEFPSINRPDGGTLAGTIAALDLILELAGPDTWLVTSHGQVVRRGAVEAQRTLLLTARDRAAAMIRQGQTLEEVQAADIARGLGAAALPGHVSAQQFVRDLYNELKAQG